MCPEVCGCEYAGDSCVDGALGGAAEGCLVDGAGEAEAYCIDVYGAGGYGAGGEALIDCSADAAWIYSVAC